MGTAEKIVGVGKTVLTRSVNFYKDRTPEAKSAIVGASALGGVTAVSGVGSSIGIAALGTAIAGTVVVPAIAASFGAVGAYALYKRHKEKNKQS